MKFQQNYLHSLAAGASDLCSRGINSAQVKKFNKTIFEPFRSIDWRETMKVLIATTLAATLTGHLLFPTFILYAFIAICSIGVVLGLRNGQHHS